MATNPVGKNSKTIGINMPKDLAADFEARAKSMHISTSNYCRIVLMKWAESGQRLNLKEDE